MMTRTGIRSPIAFFACLVTLLSAPLAQAQLRLLGTSFNTGNLLELDPQTAAATVIGPFSHNFVGKLTWVPTDQALYAVSGDSTFHDLVTINPESGATTIVGPFGVYFMQGLAYVPQTDTLYGVASGSAPRALYRINRQTGAATWLTIITGFNGPANIAFDPDSNAMYLAEVIGQNLRTLNLATGATTIIGPFNAPAMPFAQVGTGMAFNPAYGLIASDNTGIATNDNPVYHINTATGNATLIGFAGATGIAGLAFMPDAEPLPGDLNCDDIVDELDIAPFVLRLIDPAAYDDQFPDCDSVADINGDSAVNGTDLQGFVDLLTP